MDVRVAGYRGDVRVAGCGCEGGRVWYVGVFVW